MTKDAVHFSLAQRSALESGRNDRTRTRCTGADNRPANGDAGRSPRYGARHGRRPRRLFQSDDARTIAAFAERLMPGAPGKPGATDADVLNYIDLALAGAYQDQQYFYRCGLEQLDAHCNKAYGKSFPQSFGGATRRNDSDAGTGQGARVRLAECQGILRDAAHAHDGGDVRRPGLRRQQELRRLASGRFPRRASDLHRRGHAQLASVHPRAHHGPAGAGARRRAEP